MKKIHFCVTQIIRIKNLVEILDSDFFARVISRKIIVRIDDFIDLTRIYNNSAVTDSVFKKNLKKQLNELDNEFKNCLILQRHKFSAHIQDLEFGLRIDSWANISYKNIIFFHNKIIEIYELLKNQPYFIPINTNDFALSRKIINKIQAVVKDKDIESSPMASTDILAMTRFNSSGAMIPCHPIQDKVLTLNSIVIMLDFEIELYKCLEDMQYKYVLQTLIINDIISFVDNIITPLSNNSTSPNNSTDKGLDELLDNRDILDKFLHNFNLDTLAELRIIRNKLGAHIDRKDLLKDIIGLLEHHNFDNTIAIYNNFLNILYKICNNTFHLKHLTLPPTKMHGCLEVSHKPEKTFFVNPKVETSFIKKDINNIALYKNYLNKLFVEKNNDEYEDIRHFFYDALAHSEIVETVFFDNKILELTKAHKFFLTRLQGSMISDRKRIILKLLNDCSNGYPTQLVYILVTTYNGNKLTNLTKEYIAHLGDISHNYSESAMAMLTNFLNSEDINIEYFTLLSLLKIDIKDRGIKCVNKKLKIVENESSRIIKKRLDNYKPFFKVFVSILLSSEMLFNPTLGIGQKFFKELYFDYFENIFLSNIQLLELSFTENEISTIKDLKAKNLLSDIFIIIAEKFGEQNESQVFYTAIANNLLKLNFKHLPFVEHLAYSKYKIGNIHEAVEIYERLVQQNPDIIEYRIYLLDYYIEKKDLTSFNKELHYLETTFTLNDAQKDMLNNAKEKI